MLTDETSRDTAEEKENQIRGAVQIVSSLNPPLIEDDGGIQMMSFVFEGK